MNFFFFSVYDTNIILEEVSEAGLKFFPLILIEMFFSDARLGTVLTYHISAAKLDIMSALKFELV